MFQFPPCPPAGLCVQPAVTEYCSAGFPHSGISGSTFDDNSPKLIAAIRALLRLLAPRHPPHALSSLIHVRRQHLIVQPWQATIAPCYTSYFYSAQLLRCPGARTGPQRSSDPWRLPPSPARNHPPVIQAPPQNTKLPGPTPGSSAVLTCAPVLCP